MILRLRSSSLILLLCARSLPAAAVYVPLTFHAEQETIKTNACLEVNEWVYPQTSTSTSTWNGFGKPSPNPAEAALEAVVAAIRQKDRNRLAQLSDPEATAKAQEFDKQAGAFFSQFAAVKLASVPRAYALDGLAIFLGDFQTTSGRIFVPLVLRGQSDGTFRFLPSRTQQIALTLISDWFEAPWGPAKSAAPSYCSTADTSRATHRAPLTGARPVPLSPAGLLYLRESPPATNQTGGRLMPAVGRIQTSIAKGDIQQLLPLMTKGGANRLKAWYDKASTPERNAYMESLAGFKPFFAFDAAPLTIVYGRDASGSIHVMYFTTASNGATLWTNSSHVTSADEVFGHGVLLEQASLSPPFRGIELKK